MVEVSVNGEDGIKAYVDTGASHTFMHASTAQRVQLPVHRYPEPLKLDLGTKGSKGTAQGFTITDWRCAGVSCRQLFIIANIDEEVLVGRDFIRKYRVVIETDPDVIRATRLDGTGRLQPNKRAIASRKKQHPTIRAVNTTSSDDTVFPSEEEKSQFLQEMIDKYPWPDSSLPAFARFYKKHVHAGLWVPCTSTYADPMFSKIKDNGELRPLIDLRERNQLTIAQVMPPQDQDEILNAVAGAKFCTLADIQGAFQQIRIADEDVHKTAFATPHGICHTRVAQQGDRNSTVTLHRLVHHVFESLLGTSMRAYADDLWVLSESWSEHKQNVEEMLRRCLTHDFRIPISKIKIATGTRHSLGREIRQGQIGMSANKTESIVNMPPPTNKRELQRFLGTVEYNARFLPHLADVAAPLTALTGTAEWRWSKTCDLAYEAVKKLVADNAKLACIVESKLAPKGSKPKHLTSPPSYDDLCPKNDEKGEYLFLHTDASMTGTGAMLAVGTHWWNSRPVGFHSRKFTDTQKNYPVHEQEMLAVMNGLKHFDNFIRMYIFFSEFDFDSKYVKGEHNVVPDWLSRQYESDDRHPHCEVTYLEELPELRRIELSSDLYAYLQGPEIRRTDITDAESRPSRTRAQPVRFAQESFPAEKRQRQGKSKGKGKGKVRGKANAPAPPKARPNAPKESAFDRVMADRAAEKWDTLDEVELDLDPLHKSEFTTAIENGLRSDAFFKRILSNIEKFDQYKVDTVDGKTLLFHRSDGALRLCVPIAHVRGRSVREIILQHAHTIVGHGAALRVIHWLRDRFWWPTLSKDVDSYCRTCPSCQACKPSTQSPMGYLHSMPIPSKPYEEMAMDFQGPFPTATSHLGPVDALFNVIDVLTGEVIMLPCDFTGLTAEKCADLYFTFVFPHWGIPNVITSDRDVRWTLDFWRTLHAALGTTLAMSSADHPQTNGKIERIHRDINALMRQLVSEEQTDWPSHIPFVQFTLNNALNKSSGFSAFEISRIRTRTPETIPSWVLARCSHPADVFIANAQLKLAKAQDSLIKARTRQALSANEHRRAAIDPMVPSGPQIGDAPDRPAALRPQPLKFWVTTQNWPTVPFRSRKWAPKFAGPFEVLAFDPTTSTYTLDLPARYTKRRIRNIFHSSQLVPFTPTNEATFPNRVTSAVPVFPLDSLEMATTHVFEHKWARPIGSPAKRLTGTYDAKGVEVMEDVDSTILTLVMGEVGRRAEAKSFVYPQGPTSFHACAAGLYGPFCGHRSAAAA
ncbi:BQ5605_C011g06487 [Microbotryum silenes-dioicae]|uniref:RNA-directed DNA polymerase n=1 Tax=Microbotryum silenes-dioicae TaxID=796604 RepID=A0A2X0MIE1_9BASI|nr:BQ5605_C011g06487 [Microbotryum silenes-dioicae]